MSEDLVEPVVKMARFKMLNLSVGVLRDLMKNRMSAILLMATYGIASPVV